MWSASEYRLYDFGAGRKLEQLGGVWVDRPAPAAVGHPARRAAWDDAGLRFNRTHSGQRGEWTRRAPTTGDWLVRWRELVFELECNPHGQVGLFPEQAANWDWVSRQLAAETRGVAVLNLFAYTGGATLAAAASGARVTHVDAARSVIKKARRNAELSSLQDAPIRWIVDDAPTFVGREIRRGKQYDGIILDPPTYGHGARNRAWRLERDLPALLRDCWSLANHDPLFVVLSCHVGDWGPTDLRDWAHSHAPFLLDGDVRIDRLELVADDGRVLPAGVTLRYQRPGS